MLIDLTAKIPTRSGAIELPNPIIGASGSFGHSNELFEIVDPEEVGAITIKSLAQYESPGNKAPRVAAVKTGMMNSVGLPGPDISSWIKDGYLKIKETNGRFIMAIWGQTYDDYSKATSLIAPIANTFVALEINLSCPNTESGNRLFAQSEKDTKEITRLVRKELGDELPISVKLSSGVTSITDIAGAAIDGGADVLTLFNTSLGLALDPYTRRPLLGKGAGGYSGEGILPIAQKGVFEVRKAFPDVGIIGTGGISSGLSAASMMMCGANAVGIATAVFADPNAPIKIAHELKEFCFDTGVAKASDLVGTIDLD